MYVSLCILMRYHIFPIENLLFKENEKRAVWKKCVTSHNFQAKEVILLSKDVENIVMQKPFDFFCSSNTFLKKCQLYSILF